MSIAHDRKYVQFSPEELRVADYDQGRKYGDGNPNLLPSTSAAFPLAYSHFATGQQSLLQPPAATQPSTETLAAALPTFGNPTQQQTTQPSAAGASLISSTPQQQTTRPPSTGSSAFGSATTNDSQASTQSGNTSVFANQPGITLTEQSFPVLPPPFRPSRFGGIGGAVGVFGGASNHARPAVQPSPPPKKPQLRPGDFGFSPTIVYPRSDGKYLDGIPRSEPRGGTREDQDAHQDALLHLCILAETIIWPQLFNAAITAYTSGELNLLRNIPVHHVKTIYERTHSESKLREFAIDSLRRLINPAVACKDYMAMAQQHEQFLEALLMIISTTPITNAQAGSVFQMQEGTLRKVYHMDVGSVATKSRDNRSGCKGRDESDETER